MLETQESPEIKRLRNVIARIQNLPTLPHVAKRLMTMIDNPKTSAQDVNKVILTDPALTARILKLVNSAFYGFPRSISSVTHAVVILGFSAIRNLVLSTTVYDTIRSGRRSTNFEREAFWKHSLGVGVVSRVIAKKLKHVDLEDIFVAGLLHDLGKVILDQYDRANFEKVCNLVKQKNISMYEAEYQILGCSHAEVGQWLCEQWNLPQHLCETVGFHHNPGFSKHAFDMAAMVHIGDIICKTRNIGYSGDDRIPEAKMDAFKRLNLNQDMLLEINEEIESELEKATAFLTI